MAAIARCSSSTGGWRWWRWSCCRRRCVLSRWFQARSTSLRRGADPHRRRHRAAGRVAGRHGRHPGVQPRARLPAEFDELNEENRAREHPRAEAGPCSSRRSSCSACSPPACVLWVGTDCTDDGTLTLGTLIAFIGLLALRLPAAAGAVGAVRPGAVGGGRDGQDLPVLDTEPDITDAPGARPDRRASRARIDLDHVTFAYGDEPRAARARPARPGRRLHGAGRRVRRRQVDAGEADRALLRPAPTAPCASTATTCARSSCAATAASSASCCRIRSCSRARSPTTSASRRPEATDAEVEDAAAAIGVDRVAARFAAGLQHVVREGGAGLSAGERQLISIAPRAAGRSADPDPRRGHVEHRPADRAADRARARPPAARPDARSSSPTAWPRSAARTRSSSSSAARSCSAGPSRSCSRRTASSGGWRATCAPPSRTYQPRMSWRAMRGARRGGHGWPAASRRSTRPRWPAYGARSSSMRSSSPRGSRRNAQVTRCGSL